MSTEAITNLLKAAAALGEGGFQRQQLGITRDADKALLYTWGDVVSQGLVTSKYAGGKETPHIITAKGNKLIGLHA